MKNITLQKYLQADEELLQAANKGNIVEFEAAINKGASINKDNEFGLAPLMVACHTGNKNIFDKIMSIAQERKTLPYVIEKYNYKAFVKAASSNQIYMMQEMFDKTNKTQEMLVAGDGLALFYAVKNKQLKACNFITENIADKNLLKKIIISDNDAIIKLAWRQGNKEIIEQIMDCLNPDEQLDIINKYKLLKVPFVTKFVLKEIVKAAKSSSAKVEPVAAWQIILTDENEQKSFVKDLQNSSAQTSIAR